VTNTARIIKEQRKLLKMSQTELGQKIGVGKTTISNWETEYSSPDPDSLVKLSKIFGCTVDFLLGSNNKEYAEKLADELKGYNHVAKMAKDSNITPEQLAEQVRTLKKILGR
jgi:transcriptional regulator with XRE-family HTH domain